MHFVVATEQFFYVGKSSLFSRRTHQPKLYQARFQILENGIMERATVVTGKREITIEIACRPHLVRWVLYVVWGLNRAWG